MNRFFTYFGGFNQNRENYYDVSTNKNGEGKSTAVATRIIEENLPKFADDLLSYEKIKLNMVKFSKSFKIPAKN